MDSTTQARNRIKVLVIVGPTASGKSALAWELAQKYNGELISADSRQVYRGLDIGTGKEKYPQHLIDVADPKEDYNVSHFVADATKAIEDISARGKLPIIVGGTGFWVDSLTCGYELPEVEPQQELRRELEKKSAGELFAQLQDLDPARSKHIDKHNKRRLIRAIELVIATGKPTPQLRKTARYDALFLGIKISKEELNHRIEKRLRNRLQQGLIEETQKLYDSGVSWERLEAFGLEYRSVARHLQAITSKDELYKELLHAIQQYAKRQVTWFKRNKNIHWIVDVQDGEKLVDDWLRVAE